MLLTAVEFARLLKDFKCDAKTGDRRTNPRAPTHVRVQIVPIVQNGKLTKPSAQVWVRDVSRGGFGLTAKAELEVGDHVIVVMPKSDGAVYALLCKILRVQKMSVEAFTMGAQMVRRVTPEEYESVLGGDTAVMAALVRPEPAPPAAAA